MSIHNSTFNNMDINNSTFNLNSDREEIAVPQDMSLDRLKHSKVCLYIISEEFQEASENIEEHRTSV